MTDRTKYIPAIVALFATFIASIVTIVNKYDTNEALTVILVVLICSYIAGCIIKWIANTYLVVKVDEIKKETDSDETAENEQGDMDSEETVTQSSAIKNEENNEET